MRAADKFTGHLTAPTGKFAGKHAHLKIVLRHVRRNTISLTFSGRPCGKQTRCLRLRGKLHGTMTEQPSKVPDAGRGFKLSVAARIKPLGATTGTGSAHGTGFIARGRATLHLFLTASRGSVTIDANSGRLGGFTSP